MATAMPPAARTPSRPMMGSLAPAPVTALEAELAAAEVAELWRLEAAELALELMLLTAPPVPLEVAEEGITVDECEPDSVEEPEWEESVVVAASAPLEWVELTVMEPTVEVMVETASELGSVEETDSEEVPRTAVEAPETIAEDAAEAISEVRAWAVTRPTAVKTTDVMTVVRILME